MIQHIDAIHDNGILGSLEPLALPNQTPVKLTVEAEPQTDLEDKLSKQKAALRKQWEEIDKLPQHKNNDGWSARQHDEILTTAASSTNFWDNPEDDEDWNEV